MGIHATEVVFPKNTPRRHRPRRSASGRSGGCAIVSRTPAKTRLSGFRRLPVHETRLGRSQSTFLQRLTTPAPPKPASGVPYYGYRFYSPELGRWPSRDPLSQWAHQRCYLFVENSPIHNFDLFGLMSEAGCQRSVDRFMADPDRYSSVLADTLDAINEIENCKPLTPVCECCTGDAANWRGYVQGSRLIICANNADPNPSTGENTTQKLLQTLAHENMHVLQGCRNQDKQSCAGAVCAEIQAVLNSGRCQLTSPGNVRQCVIDLAVLSSKNRCPREGQAEEYADQLYGQCNRPVDEIPTPELPPPNW